MTVCLVNSFSIRLLHSNLFLNVRISVVCSHRGARTELLRVLFVFYVLLPLFNFLIIFFHIDLG